MTIYATWALSLSADGALATGPEETIRSQGIEVVPVWSDGSPENGGLILGKLSGTPTGLETWSFSEVSRAQAEALIHSTFVYMPANPEKGMEEYTLEKAIAYLD